MSSSRQHHLFAAALFLLLPLAAAAQNDEWKGFTPAPLPPPAPATSAPAAPPPPSTTHSVAAVDPTTPPPVASEAPVEGATTTKESVLPGSEPHSPGTWGNAYDASSNLRVTSGAAGATGLHRISSADLGRAGTLRLGLFGEYFSKQDFPVLRARNVRSAGTLTVDYTFHRFFEGYFAYGASANTNTRASPRLMQVQGDLALGAKTGGELFKGFYGGLDLRMNVFPGVGSQDASGYAFGFQPRLLGTYDVRAVAPKVPLRAHLNLGAAFDGTGKLVGNQTLSAAEEFALGVNRHNRLLMGVGLEAPLPVVTPFVEYGLGYPLGAANLLGPDNKPVSIGAAMPQQLSLGAKVTAIRDVTFLAAADIGLSSRVARGIPATAPYNVIFGLSYNIDPGGRGETRLVEKTTIVEKKVEVATAPPVYTGRIGGLVVDAQTRQPLANAVVAMPGTGMPPVASDVDAGKFLTHELPAGRIQLTATRDGYKPAVVEAVIEAGKVGAAQIALEREQRQAKINVTLTSGKTRVAGKIAFAGPKSSEVSTEK
ncbi:MAG: carboxypeptidase-like regulatory domain-containing protein, partial [Myxococcales bacterium]